MKRFLALILALSLLLTACGGGEEKWNTNALAEQMHPGDPLRYPAEKSGQAEPRQGGAGSEGRHSA